MADPKPKRPQPAEDGRVIFEDGDGHPLPPESRALQGHLFVDGACYPAIFKSAWRAGWAVVMVDSGGQVLKVIRGPVWAHLPQTAPAAEWTAWAVVHQMLEAKAVIYF